MRGYTTAKTYLTYYFNGELDSIIDRLRKRKDETYPEDYYCTLSSVKMRSAMSANSSGTADLTAYRAVALADMRTNRIKHFQRYASLKNDMQQQLKNYDQEELTLLKAELGLTEATKTEIILSSSFSNYKAKKKINKIINDFDKIISSVFNERDQIQKI